MNGFLLGLIVCLVRPALQQVPENVSPRGESDSSEIWFNFQRTYPFGSYPEQARRKAWQSIKRDSFDLLATPSFRWRPLGPRPTYPHFPITGLESGRIFAIAVSPADPQLVLVGGNTGGIWRSTDGGNSFIPVSDDQVDLAVGSFAFSESNPSIVYAGMGTGVGSGTGFYMGTGVLKSTNAGTTWTRVSNSTLPAPGVTVKIFVHPNDPNQLYLAQYEYRLSGKTFVSGFWTSSDGGVNWTKRFRGLPRDLVPHPSNPQIFYLTLTRVDEAGSPPPGLYQSTDGGNTWARIFTSPYDSGRTTDIRVAVTAADPQTIYIYTGGTANGTFDTRFIVSRNAGATWDSHVLTTVDTGQFGLNTYLYAASDNPNTVYIGSRDVYKSTDAGATWTNITQSFTATREGFTFTPANAKVHADQRGFALSPANPSTIYFGSDGGLWKSTDAGKTFQTLNATLSLTQAYSIAVAPDNLSLIYAGTQDNGYQVRLSGSQIWKEITTGDVGPIVVNPLDTSMVFIVDDQIVSRWRNRGQTLDKRVGQPAAFGEPTSGFRIAFVPPLAGNGVDSTLYFGTWRIFTSTDLGDTWTAPAGTLDLTKGLTGSGSDVLTAIGVGPSNTNIIYTGSSQGRAMVTSSAGKAWSDITGIIPNRFIKSIVVDPTNSAIAYLSVSGFASGHVFKTINTGQSWTDISGDLPDIPSNVPVAPLTLRLTVNQRGEPILSTLPVADLKNLPAGPLYLPQVADGAGYATQFILINTSSATGAVHLDLFDNSGNKVVLGN